MKKNFTPPLLVVRYFKQLTILLASVFIGLPGFAQTIQVNFQNPATVPPSGWVRDYGQAYGLRTGANQGKNLTYGWKKRSDNSLLNISVGGTTPGNGRDRNKPSNVLQATLVHMQANDIVGPFDGTKAEGYWEVKVPKGIYDVTVSAGDAGVYTFPERHTLNVEGARAIDKFLPTGAAGASTRFKSATVRVSVTDGNLTIDADGGTNTKINSARIVPVTTGPITFWSANEQLLTVEKGSSTSNKTFSLDLSNSTNKSVQYTLSAVYSPSGTNWLTFNKTHAGTEPNVTFNYSAAQNLSVGTYKATVKATASGFTAGSVTIQVKVNAARPYVISSTPAKGATNVNVNTSSIAANNLFVPTVTGYKGGVDNSTITSSTVKLLKVVGTSTTQIQGVVQGTGGGDAISFSPTFALEPNTTYKFMVTDGVKSYSGASFMPYTATFTTGAAIEPTDPLSVEFTKVPIAGTQNKKYSSLVIGPDDKLYALRLNGVIERFNINHTNGTLSNLTTINTLIGKYGQRTAVGLVFDPASTASNLIAYVSHCSSGLEGAPVFDGKISKLTGASLSTERLLVTNLPRSAKDHLVNSLVFGPDKALYLSQGSNSSMGAYDGSWQRTESLLSAAVLRLDLVKLGSSTLDAKTTSNQSLINKATTSQLRLSDGTYNPYATNAPLTIYASGIRNAYDLVWHSNGQLYAPANGSAAGGSTPPSVAGTKRPDGTFYSGPTIPATSGVQVQNDWLFRIKPKGYYGHPNPFRGEYVANRGYKDNSKYPSFIMPDKNYRGTAYNFSLNRSPNGAIEYKSNTFNGALKGKLLVCRFSGGGDIIVLQPGSVVKGSADSNYDIKNDYTGAGTSGLVGMSGFINPLDIVEDVKTGNLYVIEFNWNNIPDRTAQITLLRVSSISDDEGFATAFPEKITATEVVGVTETIASNLVNSLTNTTLAKKDKDKNKDKDKDKGKDKDKDKDDDNGDDGDDNNGKGKDKDKDKDKDEDDDSDLPDLSKVTLHSVTISNTGRGNLKLKNLAITGENAGEFRMLGQPDAKPNKPIKIRKNSSVTFNVAFFPTSKGFKKAKIEAVSGKKKKDQVVSVELFGLGITYEGSDTTSIGSLVDSLTSNVKKVVNLNPVLKVHPNPNPISSKIYVDLSGFNKQEPVTLSLYDTFGQLYQAKTVSTDAEGVTSTELPVTQALKPGIYILKAQSSSGQKQTRIVLE
ncbi:MAG: Ig-like domain-containing protein [Bacteroidota bacterium]|nr:Ig-like domain-containing protein [Bacteroidota bacterium]